MRFIEYKGERISKLSLGTVQFGLDYGIANSIGQPNQESVDKIIDYVYNSGINCFDTAQAYGNSEEVLGKSIRGKSNLYIISKVKSEAFNIDEVDNSLKNLNISSLYALLLHDSRLLPNWSKRCSDIVKELKESKKIRYFGVSIYNEDDFDLALKNSDIEFIQIPFNIFDQRAVGKGWLDRAKEYNKLIFIRSIFLQGLFFMDKERLPKKLELAKEDLELFDRYCKELNMSRGELALSFVDSVATDALLLFGCDSIKQADDNIKNYNKIRRLDDKIVDKIYNSFKDIDEQIYNPTKW
jgi:aryl-alcohol dehydrogenase-like predicted oxidoreductase